MNLRAEVTAIVSIAFVATGVLLGGVHWAVSGAFTPLHEEIREIRADIGRLTTGQTAIRERLSGLEARQANLEKGQAALEKGQASLESGQAEIRARPERLEAAKVTRL